jgi:predicted ATP-grasp superfamily ATP-dependent carboligase
VADALGRVDTSVPALALKLVSLDVDHGMLQIVRSLGRLGVPLTAYHESRWAPAALTRFRHRKVVWSELRPDEEKVLDHLQRVAEMFDTPPVTFASDDFTSTVLDDHGERLREWFRFPAQPAALARRLYDKRGMYEICREHDVPTPETLFPQTRDELLEMAARLQYPVVVKGIDSALLAHEHSVRVAIVQDRAALLETYDALETPGSPNLMVQEYIPGGADSVWMLDGYFDADSECLFAVTGQKLRQYPAYTGMTSLGVCMRNDTVEQATKRLMKDLGYRGILDCGWRYDERDGQYKLLDVNPRLGASFRLFVGERGMDVVRALYLDLTGQPVPEDRAPDGRKWLVENLDLSATRRYMRDGVLDARTWAGSVRGVDERAWWARDDPLPLAGMAVRFVTDRLRKSPSEETRGDDEHRDQGRGDAGVPPHDRRA